MGSNMDDLIDQIKAIIDGKGVIDTVEVAKRYHNSDISGYRTYYRCSATLLLPGGESVLHSSFGHFSERTAQLHLLKSIREWATTS